MEKKGGGEEAAGMARRGRMDFMGVKFEDGDGEE